MARPWDDEFAAFQQRKTREAIAFYVSGQAEDRGPACSLVFVQTADGNTGAKDPGLLGGGEADKHVIYEGLSRVAADAVLVGANTMRDDAFMLSVWHPSWLTCVGHAGPFKSGNWIIW